jgi:hypothetical protein
MIDLSSVEKPADFDFDFGKALATANAAWAGEVAPRNLSPAFIELTRPSATREGSSFLFRFET